MSRPSSIAKRKHDKPPLISEDEQWRLINNSGVLNRVKKHSETQPLDLSEEIFNASLVIVPMCFLLLLMDILTFHQYGQPVNLKSIVDRLIPGIPMLSVFVFYTIRHKRNPRIQFLLFLLGTGSGSRMLFLLKRSSYLINMQQTPPLITLWIYAVIQMDLGLAVANLLSVAAFCWWKKLDLLSGY
ncbi:hypothetical protein MKEN_00078700 [Mycena kentingensis (nom. inval.)]|nr:hypothetical protein MKEN_00078700 [Mycena kentingensis (nom. inval.)]